jgi:hypothetical protein
MVKNLENPPGLRFTQKLKNNNYGALIFSKHMVQPFAFPTPTLTLLLSTTSWLNFSFWNKLLGHNSHATPRI